MTETLTVRDQSRGRWLFLACTAALGIASWCICRYGVGGDGSEGWPIYLLFSAFACFIAMFRETEFDVAECLIRRRWSFLGLLPLGRSSFPIAEFSAVTVAPREDDSEITGAFVLLEPTDGDRLFWVTHCNQLSEATELAEAITAATQLPIVPYETAKTRKTAWRFR